jgi:hypothetical protein
MCGRNLFAVYATFELLRVAVAMRNQARCMVALILGLVGSKELVAAFCIR